MQKKWPYRGAPDGKCGYYDKPRRLTLVALARHLFRSADTAYRTGMTSRTGLNNENGGTMVSFAQSVPRAIPATTPRWRPDGHRPGKWPKRMDGRLHLSGQKADEARDIDVEQPHC